jgi:hypothetical protein
VNKPTWPNIHERYVTVPLETGGDAAPQVAGLPNNAQIKMMFVAHGEPNPKQCHIDAARNLLELAAAPLAGQAQDQRQVREDSQGLVDSGRLSPEDAAQAPPELSMSMFANRADYEAAKAVQEQEKDAARYRWATDLDDNAEKLYSVVMCSAGDQAKINERIDAYRSDAALSQSAGEAG